MEAVICNKCKSECDIDGKYPKFFSYCDWCKTEPQGFDVGEVAAEYWSDLVDAAELSYDR